jgi:hypothetical protein
MDKLLMIVSIMGIGIFTFLFLFMMLFESYLNRRGKSMFPPPRKSPEDIAGDIFAIIFCDDKLNNSYFKTDYKDMSDCWNSMPDEDRHRILKSVEDEIRKLK